MFKSILIGNLGGDAVVNSKDGRSFCSFRVAHNDTWKDGAGVEHSSTAWIDCIIAADHKVIPYLKAGAQVYVEGNITLRVYSSAKDRCMKAGATINVQRIELLGGSSDAVPRRLYDEQGVQHDIAKYYHCADVKGGVLKSRQGAEFGVDDNGWVMPIQEAMQSAAQQESAAESNTVNA